MEKAYTINIAAGKRKDNPYVGFFSEKMVILISAGVRSFPLFLYIKHDMLAGFNIPIMNLNSPLGPILSLFLLCWIGSPFQGVSQGQSNQPPHFEVHIVQPYITFTLDELQGAKTVFELNPHFKPEWLKTLVSAEMLAKVNGRTQKVSMRVNSLSAEAKDLMAKADRDQDIQLTLNYFPQNNLKVNPPKSMECVIRQTPENPARFKGGKEALNAYLKEKVIQPLSQRGFENKNFAAVQFSLNEKGEVVNAFVAWPSDIMDDNPLILQAIMDMPTWIPASYSDGTKVKQDVVFLLGNMESCAMYTFNINREESR
ncbi:MAG: hypothetical protein AAFY71_22075 [Bacteroidota bacterium]